MKAIKVTCHSSGHHFQKKGDQRTKQNGLQVSPGCMFRFLHSYVRFSTYMFRFLLHLYVRFSTYMFDFSFTYMFISIPLRLFFYPHLCSSIPHLYSSIPHLYSPILIYILPFLTFSSSLIHPHLFILTYSSSLIHPHLFLLSYSSSLIPPLLFLLAYPHLSSLIHPHFLLLTSNTSYLSAM